MPSKTLILQVCPMNDKTTIRIHPSSLNLIARCGAAYQFVDENYGNGMTQFGSAGHECAEVLAGMNSVDWTTIQEKYGLDDKEVTDLQWMAGSLRFTFHPDEAVIEQRFIVDIPGTNAVISCRPDIILKPSETRPCPHIHDYKFGYKDVEATSLQFKAYAWVVTEQGKCDCEVSVHQIRNRETKSLYYDRTELAAFTECLQAYAQNIENIQYVCGTHCDDMYCPGRVYCKPYREEMNRLAPLMAEEELTITPEMLTIFVRKMKMLEKALKRGKEIADAYVSEHGPLDLGDGYEYRMVETHKQELDTDAAIARLRDVYGDAFVFAAAKLTKTGITETCRNKAMPWHKRGLSTEVLNMLEANHCFADKESVSFKVVAKQITGE